jgi:plastocyanin
MQRKLLASIIIVYIGAAALGFGIVYGGGILTAKSVAKPLTITMVSEGHNGGMNSTYDHRPHDTIMPENITTFVGQEVDLTVINYDEGGHTITSGGVGIDLQFAGRTALGVPSVTHFTFTPNKAGTFLWYCRLPCDAGQGGWAMTMGPNGEAAQPGFMAGYIIVQSS